MTANAVATMPNPLPSIFAQHKIIAPDDNPIPFVNIPAPARYDSRIAEKVKERNWKIGILAPALSLPKGSKARGAILRDLAIRTHFDLTGKRLTLSVSTLRRWLDKADSDDRTALARKQRADRNNPRCLISRAWDTACPLPADQKQSIADEMNVYVRSLWASSAPGHNRIADFASSKLLELCRAAGWPGATPQNCVVGRNLVERHREASLVAIKERDAKRYFDHYIPRIKRNRLGVKPMDVVIGDVHPLDVVKDHEGREVHARLIAWLDLATYDIHVTVVLLDKGKGIRQEDIARSFVAMVQDWGLPRSLYLDNGSEYKWAEMMSGFQALSGLTTAFEAFIKTSAEVSEMVDTDADAPSTEARPIIRARPYNAPAKQIEGVFGILERGFFSLMKGWVGGDRMKKRTHKVGAAPRAYEGTVDDFEREVKTCLDLYRNTPQADGSSPNDKRRAFYDQGWQPITASREVFLFAFSEERRFKVHVGGICVDGTWGHADVLIPLVGKTITIRVAKWDRSQTFYFDADGNPYCIPMGQTFNHGDKEGAKEQSRRNGVLTAHINELKAGTVRLSLIEEAKRHVALMPPAPVLPVGIAITTREGDALAHAVATVSAPPVLRLLPGQQRHPSTGEIYALSPPKAKVPNDAPTPFDPLKFLSTAPGKKEKPNAETTTFDLIKNLSAQPRKES